MAGQVNRVLIPLVGSIRYREVHRVSVKRQRRQTRLCVATRGVESRIDPLLPHPRRMKYVAAGGRNR